MPPVVWSDWMGPSSGRDRSGVPGAQGKNGRGEPVVLCGSPAMCGGGGESKWAEVLQGKGFQGLREQ